MKKTTIIEHQHCTPAVISFHTWRTGRVLGSHRTSPLRTLGGVVYASMLLALTGYTGSSAGTSGPLGGNASGSLQQEVVPIFAAIADSEYEIGWQPAAGAYMAPNRAHNLRFTFHDDGLTIVPREPSPAVAWNATIRLASYGRAGAPAARGVGLASWAVSRTAAQIRGEGITIQYKNDREGLRQDFLVAERPPGAGPLRLDFNVKRDGVEMLVDESGGFM